MSHFHLLIYEILRFFSIFYCYNITRTAQETWNIYQITVQTNMLMTNQNQLARDSNRRSKT